KNARAAEVLRQFVSAEREQQAQEHLPADVFAETTNEPVLRLHDAERQHDAGQDADDRELRKRQRCGRDGESARHRRRDGEAEAYASQGIGWVGVKGEPRAKVMRNYIAGIIKLMKKRMRMTGQKTRPSASSRMSPLSRGHPSFVMRHPSRNSSGGSYRRKKISG